MKENQELENLVRKELENRDHVETENRIREELEIKRLEEREQRRLDWIEKRRLEEKPIGIYAANLMTSDREKIEEAKRRLLNIGVENVIGIHMVDGVAMEFKLRNPRHHGLRETFLRPDELLNM